MVHVQRIKTRWSKEGKYYPPEFDNQIRNRFDTNSITAGTSFMAHVTERVQLYVLEMINSNDKFKNVKCIFSDSSIPGEGEHKIMEFIKQQRTNYLYDPNTRHCVYGLDSDIMLLALMTHEPHFKVARKTLIKEQTSAKHTFICLDIFRDSAQKKYNHYFRNMPFCIENFIDDFVLLTFFVGNDFLPCVPTLEIYDGGLDVILTAYCRIIPEVGTYLTQENKINYVAFNAFLGALEKLEGDVIKDIPHKKGKNFYMKDDPKPMSTCAEFIFENQGLIDTNSYELIRQEFNKDVLYQRKQYEEEIDSEKMHLFTGISLTKNKQNLVREYKQNYYIDRFDLPKDNTINVITLIGEKAAEVSEHFIRGVVWCYKYYYSGCPSWSWYYPFHYAPFISSINYIDEEIEKFTLDAPLIPIMQIMAVLPLKSAHILPACLRNLVEDPQSPIADFYPDKFNIDTRGKRYKWMGTVIIPFVDEKRLSDAVLPELSKLTVREMSLNKIGYMKILLRERLITDAMMQHRAKNFLASPRKCDKGSFFFLDESLSGVLSNTYGENDIYKLYVTNHFSSANTGFERMRIKVRAFKFMPTYINV
jgi:5'-3' exonuclease